LIYLYSFDGVFGDIEGFSGKRDIDFVRALSAAFGVVAIASEAVSVREVFEDAHI